MFSGVHKRAYRLFQSNPAHPGLKFKKLEGEDDIYSARIVSTTALWR